MSSLQLRSPGSFQDLRRLPGFKNWLCVLQGQEDDRITGHGQHCTGAVWLGGIRFAHRVRCDGPVSVAAFRTSFGTARAPAACGRRADAWKNPTGGAGPGTRA
jgi:hypothetical protein